MERNNTVVIICVIKSHFTNEETDSNDWGYTTS